MLPANSICSYTLSSAEKASIFTTIRSDVPLYTPSLYPEFIARCRDAADTLPAPVYRWRDMVTAQSVGLLRNLPIDDVLPETPTVNYAADNLSLLADTIVATMASLFGTLYTIDGKGMGRHIHNMFPVLGDEHTQLASSSKTALEWHTEEAFHPARPDWLALFCVRSDFQATTRVARARDLHLDLEVVRILRQPIFQLEIDETYTKMSTSKVVVSSVLVGPEENPEIVFDPAYTVFENDAQSSAVRAVATAATNVCHCITLLPGDLLVLDNRRVLHARSSFVPRMDGTDRWLKRAFILTRSEWTSKLRDGLIPFNVNDTFHRT